MRASASHALGAFEPSRLEVRWQSRAANIFGNLRVVVWGSREVWGLHAAESFFRLRVPPARRGWQLTGSLVCHAFLLSAALAIRPMASPPARPPLPEVHITWYGPARDVVPRIAPPPKRRRHKVHARHQQPRRQAVTRGYNPHTTVVFHPAHATNRRQLLIEPQAPPQLPKSLPAMRNIIQWEARAPARPAIEIHPNQLRAARGKELKQANLRAPRITYRAPRGPKDLVPNPNAPVAPPPFLSPKATRAVRAASPGGAAADAPALARVAPAGGHLALAGGKAAEPAPPLPGSPGAAHGRRAASSYVAAADAPALARVAPADGHLALAGGKDAAPAPPLPGAPGAVHGRRAASSYVAAADAPALARVAPAGGNLAFAGGKDAASAPPLPGSLGAVHGRRAASSYVAAQGSPTVGTRSLGASTLHLPTNSAAGGVSLPPLPSAPKAARAQSSNGSGSSVAAPSIGPAAGRLVSLSLSPGAAPPPPGNAYAPMSIGPHPGRKGVPAAPNSVGSGGPGKAPGFPAPEGSATGPEGFLILHNAKTPAPPPVPQPPASARPKPARVAARRVAAAVPRRPVPAPRPANPEKGHGRSALLPGPISVAHNVLLVGVILQDRVNRPNGTWQMPTLPMNLPKLSNSRGTWVLDFADPMPASLRKQNKLIVPLPERAVEPQFPAALRQKGVHGKVVLLAVIGSNGRVRQVRVTQSLNPVLDKKAKAAFSRWKFAPALLNDKRIAMSVIVTVPFLYTPAPQ
jgi:TonB family protein